LTSIEPRTVLPLEAAVAVHFALKPLPAVNFAVRPAINADTTNLIFNKLPFVHASVGNLEHALALLHSIFVFSLILRSVRPFFNASTMLLVVLPVALVTGPVWLDAGSFTIHLVLGPSTLKKSAVLVDEHALAARLPF